MSYLDALAMADAIPARCATTLDGHAASDQHPALGWSASEYVCHMVDNFRIWAERLAAASRTSVVLVPYDSDALAEARVYRSIPIEGALWSLQRAERDWAEAASMAELAGAVLMHPDRGEQSVEEVVRGNVDDAVHHHWDIERSIGVA